MSHCPTSRSLLAAWLTAGWVVLGSQSALAWTPLNVQGYGSFGYSALIKAEDGKRDGLLDCMGLLGANASGLESLAKSDAAQLQAQQAVTAFRTANPQASQQQITALASQAAQAYALRTFANQNCNPDDPVKVTSYDGIDKTGSYARDLKVGISIIGNLGDRLTAQAVLGAATSPSVNGQDRRPEMAVKLLVLRYQADQNITLIAGQQAVPLWMISEEKQVAFTYPWVRPPASVYAMSDLSSLQGARGIYTFNLGDYTVKPSLTFGQIHDYAADNGFGTPGVKVKAGYFNVDVDLNKVYFRGVYGKGQGMVDLSQPDATVMTTFGTVATIPDAVVSRLNLNYTFQEIGLRSELYRILFMAEYAAMKVDYAGVTGPVAAVVGAGDSSRISGYYGTLGYHVTDRLLPRVTYGASTSRSTYSGAAAVSTAASLKAAGADSRLSTIPDHSGSTMVNVGANYNLTERAILKVEWEQVKMLGLDSSRAHEAGQVWLPRGSKATTVKSVIDFVF